MEIGLARSKGLHRILVNLPLYFSARYLPMRPGAQTGHIFDPIRRVRQPGKVRAGDVRVEFRPEKPPEGNTSSEYYIAIVGCYGFPGLFFICSLHFVPHHNSFRLYLTLLKDSKLFILFCFMLCFFPLGLCPFYFSSFFILQFGLEIKNINPPNGCS